MGMYRAAYPGFSATRGNMIRIRKSIVATLTTFAAVAVIGVSVAHGGPGTAFNAPVKVTPDLGFGYEPATVADGYGNIFVTAHKENWQLALAPDATSPTSTRSMSWVWTSVDGGHSFVDPPGLSSISIEQHQFGDEGDLAFDDANHLYFVDTNVADDTIARWSVTGAGLANMKLDFTRPLIPAAQLVDDRPWVTAHGNGHVFYLGNEGHKVTYQLADRLRGPRRVDLGAVHRQHADDQLRVRPIREHDLRPGHEPAVALSLDRPRQDVGVEGHHTGPRPLPVRLARRLGRRKQARRWDLLPAEQRLRLAGLRGDLQPVAEARTHVARSGKSGRARERGGAGRPDGELLQPRRHARRR